MYPDRSGKNNSFYGKHHTEETKSKLSQYRLGKKGIPWTEERKKQMSIRLSGKNNPMYGKHPSKETRLKLSDAGRRRIHSEESKQTMRIIKAGSELEKQIIDLYTINKLTTKQSVKQLNLSSSHLCIYSLLNRNNI